MKRTGIAATALLAVLVVAGCTADPPSPSPSSALPSVEWSPALVSTPAATPTIPADDAGRLVLVSDLAGATDGEGYTFWVVRPDGSDRTPIGDGFQAQWSPGGTQIYVSRLGADCVPQVTSVNPDGTGAVVLPLELRIGDGPFTWSSDGRQIMFIRYRNPVECRHASAGLEYDPWMMNADGSDQHRLDAWWPVVNLSPDGQRQTAAHGSGPVGPWDSISVEDLAGTVLASLGPEPGISYLGPPTWSADGSRVAFAIRDELGTQRAYVARADLTDFAPLLPADTPIQLYSAPAWLPVGRTLIFSALADGLATIWTIGAEGAGLRRFTPDDFEDFGFTLSPSGLTVAVSRSGAVVIVDLNGATVGELGSGFEPRWQPDLQPALDAR